MYKTLFLFVFLIRIGVCNAQLNLQCNGRDQHSVYLIGVENSNNMIYRVDSVDTNPSQLKPVMPVNYIAFGISINPYLSVSSSPLTMYYVSSWEEYFYWNGTGWINTGHTSGGPGAYNPGGTSDYIFNEGYSGTIYRYDGTGNGTPLITVFNAHIPDIAIDSLGNFYLYHNFSKIITVWDPNGFSIDTLYTKGSVPTNGGGGFALLGNRFYIDTPSDLHEGIINGDSVNFSSIVTHPNIYTRDIATCPNAAFPVSVSNSPEKPNFTIYPNPSRDVSIVRLKHTESLHVYDHLGKLCKSVSVKGLNEYRLDVSDLIPGMYLIVALSETNTKATRKLLVY